MVRLRGVGPGCNTREIADKLMELKAELDDLALRENELDQQKVWVQQSIKNVTDDSGNSPYPSEPDWNHRNGPQVQVLFLSCRVRTRLNFLNGFGCWHRSVSVETLPLVDYFQQSVL